ncbi:hypothetical protein DYB32_002682, partial [Aphanomyces invadans]
MVPVEAGAQDGSVMAVTSPAMFVPEVLIDCHQPQATDSRSDNSAPTPSFVFAPVDLLDVHKPTVLQFVPVDLTEEDDVDSLDDDDDVEIAAILKEAAIITDLAIQEGRIEPSRGDHSVMNDVQQASTAIRSTSSPTLGPHQEQPVATTLFSPVELLSPTTGATAMLHEPSVGTPPLAQGFRMDTAAHRPGRTSTSTTPTYSDASTPSPPTPQHDGTKRRKRPPRAAARVSRPTTDNIQTISTLQRMVKHNAKVAHIVVTQKRPKATYPTASRTEASKAPQTPPSIHSSTNRSGTVFAKLSDAHHCRFYPKKTKASVAAMRNPACGYDFVHRGHDGDDGTAGNDFLNRMQVAEQNRRK